MKTLIRHLAVVVSAVYAASALPARAEMLLDWNTQAINAIQANSTDVAQASRDLALMSTAIYDAINGIDGGFTAYFVQGSGPSGASMEAAAASAAKTVLEALYPSMGSSFTTLYADQLSTIGNGQAKTDGINWGSQVATAILTARAGDGASNAATTPYNPSGQIGRWAATPTHSGPGYQFPPTEPGWGNVVPFGITQGNQFRPAGTLDVTSAAYAASFNEVKDLGSGTSATRTAEQTTAAYAWAGAIGTATAAGQWNQVAANIIQSAVLDLRTQARILATLNIAVADATISAFDASYANDNWRPVTGIAYGGDNVVDFDGNALTTGDDFWDPLLDTPPMPSFVNANTAIAGAAAKVLKYYFGNTSLQLMVDTDGDGIADSLVTYSVDGALNDAKMAPIYGGTDFGYATDAGALAGDQSADYDLAHYFLPVAQVPEPSSLLLVAGGLTLLRRRRRA
ncbi:MAG: repeat-associated core domain protein [Verrucomicrobiaceae bacterium]|nr:repeat-associated core domain protein [Verrucomicrobiaceae bacterium]